MDDAFHYPPELLTLLTDTIPKLCKSYEDTLLFFRGAGVPSELSQDLWRQFRTDKTQLDKYKIARTILSRINERGDSTLKARREVVKRVVEFEDFSICWPNDQLKAKGLVSDIRRIVGVKDAFTRMNQEREEERRSHIAVKEAELKALQTRKATLEQIKSELYALFGETDPHKRGKSLEGILNKLFKAFDILVTEAFTVCGDNGEGVIEQIDGVVLLDGHHYLVEMKWWNTKLGKEQVCPHLVSVHNRGHARGILISATGYTDPAITIVKENLQTAVFVLCNLEEIVMTLDRGLDLRKLLKLKVDAAVGPKNPFHQPIAAGEL